jgi:Cu/Ag efflux protein CusF
MAAMTMTYKVKNDSELALSSNGDSITADVVVVNGDMWLENVRITQRSNARPKKTGGPN